MTDATRHFVSFASECHADSFPAKARAMAVDAITDCLGCMIAGADEQVSQKLARVVGGTPDDAGGSFVPLVGTGRRDGRFGANRLRTRT